MKKTIVNIDLVPFELQAPIDHIPAIHQRRVKDCYAKPSAVKQSIELDWVKFFVEYIDNYTLGVKSYNCNFFTLEAIGTYHDLPYYFEITPSHNRLYPIEIPR